MASPTQPSHTPRCNFNHKNTLSGCLCGSNKPFLVEEFAHLQHGESSRPAALWPVQEDSISGRLSQSTVSQDLSRGHFGIPLDVVHQRRPLEFGSTSASESVVPHQTAVKSDPDNAIQEQSSFLKYPHAQRFVPRTRPQPTLFMPKDNSPTSLKSELPIPVQSQESRSLIERYLAQCSSEPATLSSQSIPSSLSGPQRTSDSNKNWVAIRGFDKTLDHVLLQGVLKEFGKLTRFSVNRTTKTFFAQFKRPEAAAAVVAAKTLEVGSETVLVKAYEQTPSSQRPTPASPNQAPQHVAPAPAPAVAPEKKAWQSTPAKEYAPRENMRDRLLKKTTELKDELQYLPSSGPHQKRAAAAFHRNEKALAKLPDLSMEQFQALPAREPLRYHSDEDPEGWKEVKARQSKKKPDPVQRPQPKPVRRSSEPDPLLTAHLLSLCGPRYALPPGTWAWLEIPGSFCCEDLGDGKICEQYHPKTWHYDVYSIPLIVHWSGPVQIEKETALAPYLRNYDRCDCVTTPHHYPGTCKAGWWKLNPYSYDNAIRRMKEGVMDDKFKAFLNPFGWEQEFIPVHPGYYIPKGRKINVGGMVVCEGFDLPPHKNYPKLEKPWDLGFNCGLVHKSDAGHEMVQSMIKINKPSPKRTEKPLSYMNRADRVAKFRPIALRSLLRPVYEAATAWQTSQDWMDGNDLPSQRYQFWPKHGVHEMMKSTQIESSSSSAPLSSKDKAPPAPHPSKQETPPAPVRPEEEIAAEVNWKSYRTHPRLSAHGWYPGSFQWFKSEFWGMVDQELTYPERQEHKDFVLPEKEKYDALSVLLTGSKDPQQREAIKSELVNIVAAIEECLKPVIKAWVPLGGKKSSVTFKTPSMDPTNSALLATARALVQEKAHTFICDLSRGMQGHDYGVSGSYQNSMREACIGQAELPKPDSDEAKLQHMAYYSQKVLIKLDSLRRKSFWSYMNKMSISLADGKSYEDYIRLIPENEQVNLQTDPESISLFIQHVFGEGRIIRGQSLRAIIEELFTTLTKHAYKWRDAPERHVRSFDHDKVLIREAFKACGDQLADRINAACTIADRPFKPSKHIPMESAVEKSLRKLFFHKQLEHKLQKLCAGYWPNHVETKGSLPEVVFADSFATFLESESVWEDGDWGKGASAEAT